MATKLERTNRPGIFRRHVKGCPGGRCECAYVTTWRAHGRQHTETHRTLAEAREAKRAHEADVARGEFSPRTRDTLDESARERGWTATRATAGAATREETRREYRALLDKYALAYFPPRLPLSEVTPREIAEFVGWLVRRPNGRGGTLSDKTVRNALGPLAACLATAKREGLIRANPVDGAALPYRPKIAEDDERPRPFPRDDYGASRLARASRAPADVRVARGDGCAALGATRIRGAPPCARG